MTEAEKLKKDEENVFLSILRTHDQESLEDLLEHWDGQSPLISFSVIKSNLSLEKTHAVTSREGAEAVTQIVIPAVSVCVKSEQFIDVLKEVKFSSLSLMNSGASSIINDVENLISFYTTAILNNHTNG